MRTLFANETTQPTVDRSLLKIRFCDVAARFKQEFPLAVPFLPQASGNIHELVTFHIIQHDNISASINRFICLCLVPNFHVKQKGETTYCASLLYRRRDGAYIILQ